MEDPHGVQVIDDDGVWYDLDSQEDIEYDPHVGEVLGDDGIWYTKGLPEEKEDALACARTSPAKCGQLFDAVSDNAFDKVFEILCWDDKSSDKIEYRKWYVNEKSWDDWKPLHAAAEAGHTDMAKLMIDCGAEINALTTVNHTALTLAASGGHDDIVKLLLDNDADILVHTETGMCGTALHYAAAKSYYECVRLLTEAPGSEELVNELNGEYCTALYYAVLGCHTDIVKLLLAKGAKETINATDWDGQTALHVAAPLEGSLQIVKLLVEVGGADTSLIDQNGRTPALVAKEMRQCSKEAHIGVINYLDGK